MPVTIHAIELNGAGASAAAAHSYPLGVRVERNRGTNDLSVRDQAGREIAAQASGSWLRYEITPADELEQAAAGLGSDSEATIAGRIHAEDRGHLSDGTRMYAGSALVRAYARGHLDGTAAARA